MRSPTVALRFLPFAILPFAVGCMPQQPPVSLPVAEEAPPPAERVVASIVTMPSPGSARPAAAPASDADRVRPDPRFFLIGAGYGAVGQVDLTPCRDRGLDPGYVHMHVTFGGVGVVAHAIVESPVQPSPDALACIGERLQAASVPAFEGGDVTLSKSIFVAAGTVGPEIFVKGEGPSRQLTMAP
jgi:hypothetical protein